MDAEKLGIRIRQARERKGISQEDLAHSTSRDQRAISEYERGKRKLAVTDLPTFARELDVPILYFFEDDLTSQDIDRALLEEFQQIPSAELKRDALALIRLFTTALARISQK